MYYGTEGRDLDLRVAIELMGFKCYSLQRPGEQRMWFASPPDLEWFSAEVRERIGWQEASPEETPFGDALREVPLFSTTASGAWKIVERLQADGCYLSMDLAPKGHRVQIIRYPKPPDPGEPWGADQKVTVVGDSKVSMFEALCKAALAYARRVGEVTARATTP